MITFSGYHCILTGLQRISIFYISDKFLYIWRHHYFEILGQNKRTKLISFPDSNLFCVKESLLQMPSKIDVNWVKLRSLRTSYFTLSIMCFCKRILTKKRASTTWAVTNPGFSYPGPRGYVINLQLYANYFFCFKINDSNKLFKTVFLNLLGSKSRLKKFFKVIVPVKKIDSGYVTSIWIFSTIDQTITSKTFKRIG